MQDPHHLIQFSPAGRDLMTGSEDDPSPLRGTKLLLLFGGHLDAGHLTEQIRYLLFNRLNHEQLITFDTDQLIDYRAQRPHITFDGEKFTDYQRPEISLDVFTDEMDQPFLVLSGPEPDYQWERFSDAVMSIVRELDLSQVAIVDAIPLPVPHTRPLGVTTHGSREELLEGLSTWSPQAQMLAGMSQLLEVKLTENGRKVTGFTLHVPHYLADATYPQAAVAGLEYLSAAMGIVVPTDELREAGRQVDRQLAQQTENSPQISHMVAALEAQFDRYTEDQEQPRSLLLPPNQHIPDGEEIGAQAEDFLNTQSQHNAERLGLSSTAHDEDESAEESNGAESGSETDGDNPQDSDGR
ncbi:MULTISPECIES: proteasome assembly chaperone family protein [Auritidibacter]|uniref:proteasome assembly chaperone family protein n=1 Tax=Auritidibacter TaxID=1160973 RepID=UPI000D72A7C4|nr:MULTISPECIES: PAC2 family protein [Auritidibacter]NIH70399.1 putative ATP-grasp superfamily ATP-dependent carboligase [Auritidibacter ignavus]PXA81395.1 PAC2 family protein [Auritidibacter sp. NML120636]RMX23636.1 PAC2 family protein [Auritidibacter ignavus]WGH86890.1 PAC2 family protein [Auritidibacter ignavus]WGH89174.1 PAC2 family protein [Auritidibacter ignavus]